MTRICIADNQLLVREGLKAMLATCGLFQIVGKSVESEETWALIKTAKPDVLILSMSFPADIRMELIKSCKRLHIAVLLIAEDELMEPQVCEAMQQGASGFVDDGCSLNDFIEAIQTVAAGEEYFSKDLSARIRKRLSFPEGFPSHLTKRELQTLELAATGESCRAIATNLGLSCRTVESYRADGMKKIGVLNQTELVRYAIRHHILDA